MTARMCVHVSQKVCASAEVYFQRVFCDHSPELCCLLQGVPVKRILEGTDALIDVPGQTNSEIIGGGVEFGFSL